MSRRRISPVSAPPLDDEDLLEEILLRLPPQPSSLPRASLVCKRWRSILSDPNFSKRFRKRHQRPPLLGFFIGSRSASQVFTATLDSPDRIPSTRFTLPREGRSCQIGQWYFMGCRHGLAVLVHPGLCEIVVWDPLTGQQHRVIFPPGREYKQVGYYATTVMCADAKDRHVHGDCLSSPFKLVLICNTYTHASACLYESASGVWGDIVSMRTIKMICHVKHNVFVGNALYWLLDEGDILSFDLERQSLDVINKPEHTHTTDFYGYVQLLRTNGGLGLAYLSEPLRSELTLQLWERRFNFDGVVEWILLHNTIPLEEMLPRGVLSGRKNVCLVGYDEDTNVIVLATMIGNFMLQLDSIQIRLIQREDICYDIFYPYTNFYNAGNSQPTIYTDHAKKFQFFSSYFRKRSWVEMVGS